MTVPAAANCLHHGSGPSAKTVLSSGSDHDSPWQAEPFENPVQEIGCRDSSASASGYGRTRTGSSYTGMPDGVTNRLVVIAKRALRGCAPACSTRLQLASAADCLIIVSKSVELFIYRRGP